MKYADLHTHTIYSDGSAEPAQNVRDCAELGLEVMAITDHDNIVGYFEAKREAKDWGINLLSGVEISTIKYHILGYDFDPHNRTLLDLLQYSRDLQEKRCRLRVEKLYEQGIPITMEKVREHSPRARLGKGNILTALLKDPECRSVLRCKDRRSILKTYLSRGNPAYDIGPTPEIHPKDAICAIHTGGGLAVLAHPGKDIEDWSELEVLIGYGLDGLEMQPRFYKSHAAVPQKAKEHNLLLTYGSDYHGGKLTERALLECQDNLVPEFWK